MEQDAKWCLGRDDFDNAWQGLLDCAQYLFHAAAFPSATYKLLHVCLIQWHVKYPSKHLLALVLVTVQK